LTFTLTDDNFVVAQSGLEVRRLGQRQWK